MIKWSKVLSRPENVVAVASFAEGKLSGRGIVRYLSKDTTARREIDRAIRDRNVDQVRTLARKAVNRVCSKGNANSSAIVAR